MIETPSFPVAGLVGRESHALCEALFLMQSVFPRSEINEGEKLLWLWMVVHCALAKKTSCVFSYQHLADMMTWKVDSIHRALLRLKLMGFLLCDLPFLHGVVTPAASILRHTFTPTFPEYEEAKKREITINLLRPSSLRLDVTGNISGGCDENTSDALFNPTPSCYGLPWTEVLRCVLNMLKTDKVWSS